MLKYFLAYVVFLNFFTVHYSRVDTMPRENPPLFPPYVSIVQMGMEEGKIMKLVHFIEIYKKSSPRKCRWKEKVAVKRVLFETKSLLILSW